MCSLHSNLLLKPPGMFPNVPAFKLAANANPPRPRRQLLPDWQGLMTQSKPRNLSRSATPSAHIGVHRFRRRFCPVDTRRWPITPARDLPDSRGRVRECSGRPEFHSAGPAPSSPARYSLNVRTPGNPRSKKFLLPQMAKNSAGDRHRQGQRSDSPSPNPPAS